MRESRPVRHNPNKREGFVKICKRQGFFMKQKRRLKAINEKLFEFMKKEERALGGALLKGRLKLGLASGRRPSDKGKSYKIDCSYFLYNIF